MKKRSSGILLHPTSLPSPYGIGDLGPAAYEFVDFLARTGQGYWQILPLTPTDTVNGNSPYSSASAFACNPLLISPELLAKDGLLEEAAIDPPLGFSPGAVDYEAVTQYKTSLIDKAFHRWRQAEDEDFDRFRGENASWLEDYALFTAIKESRGGLPWNLWPAGLRDREPEALAGVRKDLADRILRLMFIQHLFYRQWSALKDHCHEHGIQIIGDLPIYVSYDSADTWAHPEIFDLGQDGTPRTVAGVPPDYFSATGQLWGNPVYDWATLSRNGFSWWIQRMGHILNLVDMVRVDHFRGLVAFWEVSASAKTALEGHWVNAPFDDLFRTLLRYYPDLPVIAEDLGVITPDVTEAMHRYGFPGMKVLLFAFGEDNPMHPYLPHNFEENCVVYTGTHDNNTALGWFREDITPEDRGRLFAYLGREVPAEEVPGVLARLAMSSVARLAVLPMQDILGLDSAALMNRPSRKDGNWKWRLLPGEMTSKEEWLRELTVTYGRI